MSQSSELAERWDADWPAALASWSPYTLLRPPIYFETQEKAEAGGMAGQVAAIRLADQTVMVNLATVRELGLEEHSLAILAHEIGHHVHVPGNLADNARMLAAMKPMLIGLPSETPAMVANLYGDLHLNDRLQRRHGIDVASVYVRLRESVKTADPTETWKVYTRSYEHLWRLPPGTIAPPGINPVVNADALLIARLIRHFSVRWLAGARRFAAIVFPYLNADREKRQTFLLAGLGDCEDCGKGAAIPDGLTAVDPIESGEDGEFDAAINGEVADDCDQSPQKSEAGKRSPGTQHRSPLEYADLLRGMGLVLPEHQATARYYRERAKPHLLPFPTRRQPAATETHPEGYEGWDAGDDLQDLDMLGSLMRSPVVVPGITTVRRVQGEVAGKEPDRAPVDLDIYIDCSGSMPNPSLDTSYLALCGTILVLSALRAGASVQATLWSGPSQFKTTSGFIRDENRLIDTVTGYICGSTAFPLHVLRETYRERRANARTTHIVVISDEGVDTMLANDETGAPGAEICRLALERAKAGGTLVLNLANPENWDAGKSLEGLGFRIHPVRDWEQLVAFAARFARETYE